MPLPDPADRRAGAESPGAERYRRQLETVANNATLALFVIDERQHCTYMNPAAERLTGFTLADLRGKPLHDHVHHTRPDGSPYPLEECPIARALPHNERAQGEEVFVHRDGHLYPVAFTASPILHDGRPVGTIVEARDITEEKRTAAERERLLQERERLVRELEWRGRALEVERSRLAAVFRQVPAFIATVWGPDHVFEMANPSYRRFIGDRDIMRKPFREALPELVEQGFLELLDRVYRTGEPFVGEETPVLLRRGPGAELEEAFVTVVFEPLTDPSGAVTGILSHGVDVTELVRARRRAEEQAVELEAQAAQLQRQTRQLEETQVELEMANHELARANADLLLRAEQAERARRESEEAHAVADVFYAASPVPAAVVDRDLRFQRINAAFAAFYGLAPGEVVGRTIREVVPDYADRVEPYYQHVFGTGEPIRDMPVVVPSRVSGEDRHFLLNYFPVWVGQEVIGVGVVSLDVTERHRMEEAQRRQTALVETLQRVGRSVAAELDLERVVQEVTDAATVLTGAQFGAFFYNVVGEEGESYTLYTISGVDREKFARFPMPRATPVFGPVFHGEGTMRSGDITRDPRYGQMPPYYGMPEGHLPVTS